MTTAKTTIHVIPHTHWDREWYMPFEAHHMRLIKTIDSLLEIMEQDPDYHSFYLDGQTIILDDYLQIYPEKREKLIELCNQGKLSAGPWYILQDEFLTSGEANLRNLQIGHRDAKAFGDVSKIGYFPDSFGNMGQAAQILQQAGISNAIFGRGVKATGFNNQVAEASELESPFSELQWESPDGSQVLGILFANWYNNGMEIPVEKEKAQLFWEKAIPNAVRYASTRHLSLMAIRRLRPKAYLHKSKLLKIMLIALQLKSSSSCKFLSALTSNCRKKSIRWYRSCIDKAPTSIC